MDWLAYYTPSVLVGALAFVCTVLYGSRQAAVRRAQALADELQQERRSVANISQECAELANENNRLTAQLREANMPNQTRPRSWVHTGRPQMVVETDLARDAYRIRIGNAVRLVPTHEVEESDDYATAVARLQRQAAMQRDRMLTDALWNNAQRRSLRSTRFTGPEAEDL